MNVLFKFLPIVLLNTTIWVMLYYYIKSVKSGAFDKKQIGKLRMGLAVVIGAVAGGEIFQDQLIQFLSENDLYQSSVQQYFNAYYFFWGLLSAIGLLIFMGVGFSKSEPKT